jgi:hypothetical protein
MGYSFWRGLGYFISIIIIIVGFLFFPIGLVGVVIGFIFIWMLKRSASQQRMERAMKEMNQRDKERTFRELADRDREMKLQKEDKDKERK